MKRLNFCNSTGPWSNEFLLGPLHPPQNLQHLPESFKNRYQKNMFPPYFVFDVFWCHLTFERVLGNHYVRNLTLTSIPPKTALASCPGSVFDTAVTDSGSGCPMASAPMTWRFKPAVMALGEYRPSRKLT